GILGLLLFLEHWFHISPSITNILLDGTCYLIGAIVLGKGFFAKSVFCSCVFSLVYRLYETFPPFIPSLQDHPLIAAILGGIFVGIGVGIVVRNGGAVGGDDALAMTISHLSTLSIPQVYFITDTVVLLISLSYIPVSTILYSFLTVMLSSWIIGKIVDVN
ncbi:MAG: YitT family protein, partial [Erysipelotrichales bacterium]|nr:YitT family protein [Erysipelotrichales bacterium]